MEGLVQDWTLLFLSLKKKSFSTGQFYWARSVCFDLFGHIFGL